MGRYQRLREPKAANTPRHINASFSPEQQRHILAANKHSWAKGLRAVVDRDLARTAAEKAVPA